SLLCFLLTCDDSGLDERNGILDRNSSCIGIVANDQAELLLNFISPCRVNVFSHRITGFLVEDFIVTKNKSANNVLFIRQLSQIHKFGESEGERIRNRLVPILVLNFLRIAASGHSQEYPQTLSCLGSVQLLLS